MADLDNTALETWLTETEREIADLQILAAKLRERLGRPPGEAPGLPSLANVSQPPGSMGVTGMGAVGRIRPDEFFRMSMPEAIKKYLAIMKQPQGPKAIVDGLRAGGLLTNAKHFYANVTTALKRLRIAEQVVLTPNGWGLAEWYPSRPRGEESKKARGRRKRTKSTPRPAAKRLPSGSAKPETTAPGANGKVEGPRHAIVNSYRLFLSEAMKAGKTMAEAAEEWRNRRAEG